MNEKKSKFWIFHLFWLAIVSATFTLALLREGIAEPCLFGVPSTLWGGVASSAALLILVVFAASRAKDIEDA